MRKKYEQNIGIDTVVMYRGVLDPRRIDERYLSSFEESTQRFVFAGLIRGWNAMLEFLKSPTLRLTRVKSMSKVGEIREFLWYMGWSNLMTYDIVELSAGHIDRRYGGYKYMIIKYRVWDEKGEKYYEISPQIQIGYNCKIWINCSLYSYYYRDAMKVMEDIDYVDAFLDLRDEMNRLWDDVRIDMNCHPNMLPDNRKWMVSRIDIKCDIETQKLERSYRIIEEMSRVSIPGYETELYTQTRGVKFKPRATHRLKRNTQELQEFGANIPYMVMYEKSLELMQKCGQGSNPMLRFEKRYYSKTMNRTKLFKQFKKDIQVMMEHEDRKDYHGMTNELLRDAMVKIYFYGDDLIKTYEKVEKRIQDRKNEKLDEREWNVLEMVNAYSGSATLTYYTKILGISIQNLRTILKNMNKKGLVENVERKWRVTERGEKLMKG